MINLLMGRAPVVLQEVVIVGADGAGDGFGHGLDILLVKHGASVSISFKLFFF